MNATAERATYRIAYTDQQGDSQDLGQTTTSLAMAKRVAFDTIRREGYAGVRIWKVETVFEFDMARIR